mgnify:FL=1
MKTINKLLWYFLYYASSTLFVYFVFHAGMGFINLDPSNLTIDYVGKNAFLPFLYSSLLLVIMTVTQTRILKQNEKREEFIYGCFNLIFSLLETALGIILLSLGASKNSLPLNVSASMILGLGIIELGYSIFLLIDQAKRVEEKDVNS